MRWEHEKYTTDIINMNTILVRKPEGNTLVNLGIDRLLNGSNLNRFGE